MNKSWFPYPILDTLLKLQSEKTIKTFFSVIFDFDIYFQHLIFEDSLKYICNLTTCKLSFL